MRSVAEIDADIAEVQKRIAARNEGTPLRNSPEYRAARFDYIVDGDRSGLDAYQNALNLAIQNKLSRDAQERMLKEGKQQADDEQMDQWQKDYTFAKSAQAEAYANPKATTRERENADANVRYYEAVGTKKGYMKKYSDMTKAPEGEPKPEAPAPKKTWGQTRASAHTAAYSKNSTKEDVETALKEVNEYSDNDYVQQEAAEARTALNNRGEEIREGDWTKFKNKVKAAKDKKDKEALQSLLDGSKEFEDRTDYDTVKGDIEKALKPPKKDNLLDLVYKQYSIDALSNIALDLSADNSGKGITKPVSGGRNATFVRLSNGDIEVRNEKGTKVGVIPKSKLKADLNVSKNTTITKVAPKKPKNQVEAVLTSGKDSVEILPIKGEIW